MDTKRIPIIRGRAYHPRTQGSVEVANRTFKVRLYDEISESGDRNWAPRLDEIAEVINTTRPSCLPTHITPYEVWFGRTPRFQDFEEALEQVPEAVDIEDSVDEDYIFSELYRKVFLNNAKEAAKIVKKGGKPIEYTVG